MLAKNVHCDAVELGDLRALICLVRTALFSAKFGEVTVSLLNQIVEATSLHEFQSGPLSAHPAVRRGLAQLRALDSQFFEIVSSAAAKDKLRPDLSSDLSALRRSAPSQLVAQGVLKLVNSRSSSLSKADGKMHAEALAASVANWGVLDTTPLRVVTGVQRVVHRHREACKISGFGLNHSSLDDWKRMLFEEAKGKTSPLYLQQGARLAVFVETWHAIGLADTEIQAKLLEKAAECPSTKTLALSSDTPEVEHLSMSGSAAQVAALQAQLKVLMAAKSSSSVTASGGGTGGGARVAAVAGAAATKPVSVSKGCLSCKKLDHAVSECPTTVFVPGINGAELQRWSQCWRCQSFGHVKMHCPLPPSASPLNDLAHPSAGVGSGR